MNDKSEETMVFGHSNPDTDAITAALVYTEFLCRNNVKAKAYRLGDLNNETKFVLKSAGVKEPEMIPDNVPEGTQVALVDHNESKEYDFRMLWMYYFLFYIRSTVNERFEKNAYYSCC
jgi:inorganic pyrophosphatase/exopolyphosphatase